MPLQIGIFGRGRLGSAIAAAAEQSDDIVVAWLVGHQTPQDLAPVDVALEVSHADAVADRLAWAHESGTDLIIGTTGWDPALTQTSPQSVPSQPRAAASGGERPAIGILTAPNFSLTVALMRRISLALGRYAALTGADLAVSEIHHTRKVDAPSGTAILLREALAQGSGQDAIQTTSLRLGDVVGRHDVHLTSAAEAITLTHEAHNRETYALGALTAARWLHGRRGTFTFDDLAAEVLDPLFHSTPTQKEEP
ncbi:4-hydroxy-tetrahydrodipicolinate reductase [Ornithinimicrobium faecis]|uniref:4-hydroxy-tetrahydrodipicolinate reductase n=1 Tax=Ornithinimicrobium faecis TaxID=2934158 RepID=UPI0021187455|nr:dihydrodipicolinate reductase C-terminal domain-containing protein [Ornithinimicrobium sp. HY1745]